MKTILFRSVRNSNEMLLFIVILTFSISVSGQQANDNFFPATNAYIVVTGMKLDENPKNYVKDVSVAEGAVVKLSMRNGYSEQKTTRVFIPTRNPQDIYFSADFKVEFDSTYTIEMIFKNKTSIRIENYRIPPQWKTHFYFHSTNGTKSAASVFRRQEDRETKFNCCVYGLYPFTNYKSVGGSQLTD